MEKQIPVTGIPAYAEYHEFHEESWQNRSSGTIERLKSVNTRKGTTIVTLLPPHLISVVTSIMAEGRPNGQLQNCNYCRYVLY